MVNASELVKNNTLSKNMKLIEKLFTTSNKSK